MKETILFSGKKNADFLKLFPDEKILCIQRQHWIVPLFPMMITIILFFLALAAGIFLFFQKIFIIPQSIIWSLALTVFSFLIISEIYAFMYWYYQFYIITSKRILHIHFFRIGGYHSDEVFLEISPEREIDRRPPNVFYDLLGIENVFVYFHRAERPEPFIFQLPSNAEEIEALLEELSGPWKSVKYVRGVR